MDPRRIHILQSGVPGSGPVVYWMSRDQRIHDNWAVICAQERALETNRGLVIIFCLQSGFLGAAWRQYHFMLRGLQETCKSSLDLGIPFVLRCGRPPDVISAFVHKLDAESLICDFDPLRIKSKWRSEIVTRLKVPICMVDAHNIVPCWEASSRQEYSARTIRPRIQRKLFDFLHPFSDLQTHPYQVSGLPLQEPDWEGAEEGLEVDTSISPVVWLAPGAKASKQVLDEFVTFKLQSYAQKNNDPNASVLSNLSAYLHFGQLAPQRVALQVQENEGISSHLKESFLEQLIIRRELADNFCWYSPDYDSFAALPEWAQKTLNAHRSDPRPFLYAASQLEAGQTHDDLWNAAQMQMVTTGKMHGYLRMYWAKKILEWTESPEQAISVAINLNDRYELDGRDPNGYVGVLWSVGGLHDHGFKQRPVFGTVRYMSYAGCRRKFDVQGFIHRYVRVKT
ncbi:MAG: deoxyribodipyrimidine photo-lyase [Desulfovermiculus sp.]